MVPHLDFYFLFAPCCFLTTLIGSYLFMVKSIIIINSHLGRHKTSDSKNIRIGPASGR